MSLQYAATSFGDLFPAACVASAVTAWSWRTLGRTVALIYAAAFVGTVAVTTALKFVTGAFAPTIDDAALFTLTTGAPSGHAACATFVYGAGVLLFYKLGRRWPSLLGAAACLTVIAVVYVTRVTLYTHTVADVAAGALVGAGFTAAFGQALRRSPAIAHSSALVLGGVMSVSAFVGLASGVRIASDHFM
jgi:membrane-associated phospholipid phosphatase